MEDLSSYYSGSRSAKKIALESLDPCLGIGLLIKNSSDLKVFKGAFAKGTGPLSQLVTLYEKTPVLGLSSLDNSTYMMSGGGGAQAKGSIMNVKISMDSDF